MDSISRHEQLLRVFHLVDILFGARQPLTTGELRDHLRLRGVIDDMTEKNIRRDVEFLGKFGYAIKQSKKRSERGTTCHAWSIEVGRGADELAMPAVSLPELLSLAAARDLLAPLAGTFFWRGIGQVLAKVERVATPELLAYAEAHKDGFVVHPRPAAAKYATRTLNAVHRAITGALELEIRYTSLADVRPKRTVIRPEAVVLYDGSAYVAGTRAETRAGRSTTRRREAEGIRFYKLDRIAEARPTSRSFARRRVSVADLLADSITIFRSEDPPRRYRIRVDATRARWACEKPFHPGQRVKKQPDGGVILEIERAWDAEMIPQLLALGGHVEVLEPAEARGAIVDEARRVVARYEGRTLRSFEGHHAGGRA